MCILEYLFSFSFSSLKLILTAFCVIFISVLEKRKVKVFDKIDIVYVRERNVYIFWFYGRISMRKISLLNILSSNFFYMYILFSYKRSKNFLTLVSIFSYRFRVFMIFLVFVNVCESASMTHFFLKFLPTIFK